MPILINDLNNQTIAKTYDPKFFSDKLTGRGGTSAGLLSAKNNPIMIPADKNDQTDKIHSSKRKVSTGTTKTWTIPVNPLMPESWDQMNIYNRPDLTELLLIGDDKKTGKIKLYMDMQMHGIIIHETYGINTTQVTDREISQLYQMLFYIVIDDADSAHEKIDFLAAMPHVNSYYTTFSANPLKTIQECIYPKLTNLRFNVDMKCILDYINNYEIYDAVAKRSEEWQTSIDNTLDQFFINMKNALTTSALSSTQIQHITENAVRHIMSYNIPLDIYRNIYKSIQTNFTPNLAKTICKQNLNLMLSDNMASLNANKASIQSFTPPTPSVQLPASVQNLSPEQKVAVQSTDPLILVQAGAGTGKSTLILGRIDYLEACGVNPKDITVLSFTNAAADNITAKNPHVHSMTIARMIHEIYSANFDGHELSSNDTIINSLDIYYPSVMNSPNKRNHIVYKFQQRLKALLKTDANNFTDMNNFIEENYHDVIKILDTIHQTSLDLEIIICYQQISNLIEPDSVASKFLIMDEVQDNSIFEFVYTLKYIEKHKESLFIVGDCSQTLYEFRASNPRALNILEGSKTFTTYQLNVNYRSRQEILDFANVALQNIEANQYANIQLQSNSLASVTEQSFLDKVTFNYHQLNSISQFKDALPSIMSIEIRKYIDNCLSKGEQVAFLMFTHKDVNKTRHILEHQYPDKKIISLVPDKLYNSTIMSTFIKRYWNELPFIPTTGCTATIIAEIMQRLNYLVKGALTKDIETKIHNMLLSWKDSNDNTITMWGNQVNNGQMTHAAFLDLLKRNMLSFEITSNAVKQALLSNKNQQNKVNDNIKNADFVLSTIHSAKGLEFDNVVVFYHNQNILPEDKKRMYYVAFTRAMKSEYVLAYDTVASPQIQADYMTVLRKLHNIAPSPNSPLNSKKKFKNKRITI